MPRIKVDKFKAMFEQAGIRRGDLLAALREMGPKHLKGGELKKQWSTERPTRNYCYVVSEFLFWYVAPEGSEARTVNVEGDLAPHVYMHWPDGSVVDLTCDQFENIKAVKYKESKRKTFMQSGGPGPSKRAKILAELLGYTDDDIQERMSYKKPGKAKKAKSSKKPERAVASEGLSPKAVQAIDNLELVKPDLPKIPKTMELNEELGVYVPKKELKKYSGADEDDGVIIHRPPKIIRTDYLLPYEPHEGTVCYRDDYKRTKKTPIGVKKFGIPIVEKVNGFNVVRDDLLAGGSKCRMIYKLIASGDNEEWVYASPAQGYAQIAIAICAAIAGKRTVIYVAKSKEMHPLTQKAWEFGAEIRMVPMGFLSNLTAKAHRYVQQHSGAALVPFGADHPLVRGQMKRSARMIPFAPKEVWSVLSTGVLSRGMQAAWPDAEFNGIMVGHNPDDMQRGFANVYQSPEKYSQNTKVLPPFPSASNYDAKVWQFMLKYANPGALFWNVGA